MLFDERRLALAEQNALKDALQILGNSPRIFIVWGDAVREEMMNRIDPFDPSSAQQGLLELRAMLAFVQRIEQAAKEAASPNDRRSGYEIS